MINWGIGCLRPNGIRLPERNLLTKRQTNSGLQACPISTTPHFIISFFQCFRNFTWLHSSLLLSFGLLLITTRVGFLFSFVRQLHSYHFILIKWVIPLLILFFFFRIIYFFFNLLLCVVIVLLYCYDDYTDI